MLSVQPGLRGSNDLRVGRKMATFQLFFQSGRVKDLSAPLYVPGFLRWMFVRHPNNSRYTTYSELRFVFFQSLQYSHMNLTIVHL